MALTWFALIPELNLLDADSLHQFPALTPSSCAETKVHLVLLNGRPVDLDDLPCVGLSSVFCFCSSQPLTSIKNTIRSWTHIATSAGDQGAWPWYEPVFFESVLNASSAMQKKQWLGCIEQPLFLSVSELLKTNQADGELLL